MEAKLIVIEGTANRREIAIKLPVTIGRSKTANLTVAHPMVSRQHCELLNVDGVVVIRDLASLNGTFVHGDRVDETAVRPNDIFSVGPLKFQIEYEYEGNVEDIVVSGKEGNKIEAMEAAVAEVEPATDVPQARKTEDLDDGEEDDGLSDFLEDLE